MVHIHIPEHLLGNSNRHRYGDIAPDGKGQLIASAIMILGYAIAIHWHRNRRSCHEPYGWKTSVESL